jgi:multidrug transporter EmrE-like cation transporter
MNVKEFVLTWGMLITGVIMNVCGAYVVKSKMNVLGQIDLSSLGAFFGYFIALIKFPPALLGIIAIAAAPVPQAIAVSRMALSVAYPATVAFNFLVLIPVTILFLGESFTMNKVIALGLIAISVYLLYK